MSHSVFTLKVFFKLLLILCEFLNMHPVLFISQSFHMCPWPLQSPPQKIKIKIVKKLKLK